MEALAPPASRADATRKLVALVGNPNTGKTTLFNLLTGANARVGNYPGITVERRTGTLQLGFQTVEVLDVPGTYSLSARSAEEQVAIASVLGHGGNPRPDLAVVVVDATQLIRNLYLVVQLVELKVPVVLALNMMDEARSHPPDPVAISKLLHVPCVPMSARDGEGLQALNGAIAEALPAPPVPGIELAYPEELSTDVERVRQCLPAEWRGEPPFERAMALWALTSIDADDELEGIDPGLRAKVLEVQAAAKGAADRDAMAITTRYDFLDAHQAELYGSADTGAAPGASLTDRVDRVLLHPVGGFAAFLLIMLVVFQALFTWSDPAIGLIEDLFAWAGGLAQAFLPAGFIAGLVGEGIIAGVGSVLVFLPQILLLFLFIGFMEDSGYMARVAYLMDRIMRSLGLHGRAFVPLMSGFACAVPAIMATRTMERRRDRMLTMLVVPLMTCSARLPVYTLIIAALFPPSKLAGIVPVQGLLMVAMYVFSTAVALAAAGVLSATVFKGTHPELILELPPYRLPSARSVGRYMWQRSSVFLKEAGSVILVTTVILWALLSYPKPAQSPAATASPAEVAAYEAELMSHSYAGTLGHFIEPAIRPLGFDWKIGVGLVGSFAAREVFVSTMGIVYGAGTNADEESRALRDRMRAEKRPDGSPQYTPLVGLSLMVFFALCMQCISTLAVLKRETGGWKWPAFVFGYMTVLAWSGSLLVYQGGRLLGFG